MNDLTQNPFLNKNNQRTTRFMGIDPSSTISAVAVVEHPLKAVIGVTHWERDKHMSHPESFVDYYKWVAERLDEYDPSIAIVELHAYSGPKSNAQATHAVAFYQAVSVLCCKFNGVVVIESRISTSRKTVLGRGNLSKDDSWEIMRKRYPTLFSPKTRGGLDEMDALTHAMAGPRAVEK